MPQKSCLAVLVLLVLSGCGTPVGEGIELGQLTQAAESKPVQLYFVRAESRFDFESWQALAKMSGYIRIENIAYRKSVTVRHQVGHAGQWQDLPASYLHTLDGGKEVWYFETDEVSYTPRLSADFRFAIKYDVAGQKYWDNNRGEDYRISTGPRPNYPTDLVLGRSIVALSRAVWDCDYGAFAGFIMVRNLAPAKQVEVVYTTDDWQTVNTASAGYAHPHGEGSELWYFQVPVDVCNCPPGVEFAIRYAFEGIEAWDNNFRTNYRLNPENRSWGQTPALDTYGKGVWPPV